MSVEKTVEVILLGGTDGGVPSGDVSGIGVGGPRKARGWVFDVAVVLVVRLVAIMVLVHHHHVSGVIRGRLLGRMMVSVHGVTTGRNGLRRDVVSSSLLDPRGCVGCRGGSGGVGVVLVHYFLAHLLAVLLVKPTHGGVRRSAGTFFSVLVWPALI